MVGFGLFVSLSVGCSSRILVQSDPVATQVIMNETVELGPTPFEIRQMSWLWSSPALSFSKEGYQTRYVKLESTFNPLNMLACVCTIGTLFPALFLGESHSNVFVRLEPVETASVQTLVEVPRIAFE